MRFHDLAILYAQVASAPVDTNGCLLRAVGDFASGAVRDEVLVTLEEMNRSAVVTELLQGTGQALSAHVVISVEDGASGVETAVVGVRFDAVSAQELAASTADTLCNAVNKDLARDMGTDYEPTQVTQNEPGEFCIGSCGTGLLASVVIKATRNIHNEGGNRFLPPDQPFARFDATDVRA